MIIGKEYIGILCSCVKSAIHRWPHLMHPPQNWTLLLSWCDVMAKEIEGPEGLKNLAENSQPVNEGARISIEATWLQVISCYTGWSGWVWSTQAMSGKKKKRQITGSNKKAPHPRKDHWKRFKASSFALNELWCHGKKVLCVSLGKRVSVPNISHFINQGCSSFIN